MVENYPQKPRWLERIPYWVTSLLIVGGFLLSAFAGQLPVSIQVAGLWLGVALVAMGAAGFLLHLATEAKQRGSSVLPVIGMAISALALLVCGYWFYKDHSRTSSQATDQVRPIAQSTNTSDEAALGSLKYVLLFAEIQHQARTGKTAVQMMVEIENTNDFLLKFDAQLHGEVSGVKPPNYELQFPGFVAAHSKAKLIYNRIDDVPVNHKPGIGQPVLTGLLNYSVTYWAASNPNSKKRITARTVNFEYRVPLASKPFKKPGTVEVAGYEMTTLFSNEQEE